jgi:SAM-dependent methyltransferase
MSTAMSGFPHPPVTGADPAPPVAPHQSADLSDASPARVSLTPGRHHEAHQGELDGAWWPRTRHVRTELNALVERLRLDLGAISRLSLSSTSWDSTPGHVRVADQDVRLVWFSLRDPRTVIVGYGAEEITLLVIPAAASAQSATRAMTMAADRHNSADPAEVLQASAVHSPDGRDMACATSPGESAHQQTPRRGDEASRSAADPVGAEARPPPVGRGTPTEGRRRRAYAHDAGGYDRRTRAFQTFRAAIIRALPLQPGQVVLDVGSGTGLCFASLLDKVGPSGRIIGIDASPEMVALARERVIREGWHNITLVQSPVIDAQLPALADAAVFCAVHDILRSPQALRRVMDSLRPRAWVSAGGGKWARPWMLGLNWQVQALHAPYVRSFEGFDRPWSHLERLIENVRVRELALGTGYVLTGRVQPAGHVS